MRLWKKKRTKKEEYEYRKNYYHNIAGVLFYTAEGVLGLGVILFFAQSNIWKVIALLCISLACIIAFFSGKFLDKSYDYKVCAYCLRYINCKEEHYVMTYKFCGLTSFCNEEHYNLYCDELREKRDKR